MYTYSQLDRHRKEVRLLLLAPGSGNNTLECKLKHAFIDQSPPPLYETISYVCGDPQTKSVIKLHDTEIHILASCEAALRRMRLSTTERVLWIDAICINQEDTDERSHQVGMMYAIYTNTFRNLIWLGEDDGHTAKAISSIRKILDDIEAATQGSVELRDLLWDRNGLRQYSRTVLSFDFDDSSLTQFFRSPWFFRLWVVQEASLAPCSVCHRGEFEMPLTHILRAASWIRYKWLSLPELTFQEGIPYAAAIFDTADAERGFFRHFRGRQSMSDLLDNLTEFQSLDPRDHVFAILGLWQKHTGSAELPFALRPDYTLEAHVVFRDATRFAMQEAGNLLPLAWDRGPRRGQECDRWPSWVPRLDWKPDRVNDAPKLLSLFRADNGVPMSMYEKEGRSDALYLSGLVVDEVVRVIPAIQLGMTLSKVQASMLEMERLHVDNWVESPVGGVEAKVALVLLAGTNARKIRVTTSEALQGYQDYKKYLADHQTFPPYERDLEEEASETDKVAARFQEALANSAFHRAVFHTKFGHVGLCPESTRIDDFVTILYGSRWPGVLRFDDSEFSLVGISYVYGIMDGEAVQRHRRKGLTDTLFCLV
jgi:hypothetical protein